jgi:glutamate-ammonia-ligase adenylyltransferase
MVAFLLGLIYIYNMKDMKIEEIIESGDLGALGALGFTDARRALADLLLLSGSPLGLCDNGIEGLTSAVLASPSPEMALNNLERLSKEVNRETLELVATNPEWLASLVTLSGASELLTGYICRHPEILAPLFTGGAPDISKQKDFAIFINEINRLIEADGLSDKSALKGILRHYKQREYLRIGLRDLLGIAPLEEVTAELSDLASASLQIAHDYSLLALKKRYGAPTYCNSSGKKEEAGFTVIGMGKLGGRELNFSSDIDLIYLYTTEAGETEGVDEKPSTIISLHEFFVKLAERVTTLINEITEDGNVFRVDLDLRPEGRSGEIVNSLSSVETYYESWGRTWERSAMIKARPVAGDLELGSEFLKMIEPFVYRRYLDFRAIEELKAMKERLDIELMRRNPNTIDVKLGRGGIREIEFFCQAQQLIHGGKNPEIRGKNTLTTLDALQKNALINSEDAVKLEEGYRFLRTLEHRIQIIEGRQTHALPEASREVQRIARMMVVVMGKKSSPQTESAFIEKYKEITSEVYGVYRSLFYSGTEELKDGATNEVLLLFSPEIDDEESTAELKKMGFTDPGALQSLKTLRDGSKGVRLPQGAQAMLEKIAPFLLTKTLETPDPDAALKHLEGFISAMGAHTTFYALLSENPKVAELLITIFGTSEFLSRILTEQPGAMDHLVAIDLKIPRKTKEEITDELDLFIQAARKGSENKAGGLPFEELIDAMRRLKSREILRIGINDILGELDNAGVFSQITTLAEVTLDSAIALATEELSNRYGLPVEGWPNTKKGPKFAVIGLGKLGSEDLIYGSDLDIIFVYSEETDGDGTLTTGPKEITIHEYFVKLAQKIITILTLRTREGLVFPVDMRLRPSGSAGPLVLTGKSFMTYQREKAEVWEATAMLKARAVAGNMEYAKEVTRSLEEIIYSRGLSTDELHEIKRIRERMENEIAKEEAGRYNIKTGKGGLVDIEFICQALQLKYGPKYKELRSTKAMEVLDALLDLGYLEAKDQGELKKAYVFFSNLTVKLRIVQDRAKGEIREGSKELSTLAKKLDYSGDEKKSASALLKDYISLSRNVREIYERILQGLED